VAITLAALAGFGVAPTVAGLGEQVRRAAAVGFAPVRARPAPWPEGTRPAADWLREHSAPDDLVATNAHCRFPRTPCDNLHFWFSAFAERRFLVEGWGYTPSANRIQSRTGMPGNEIPYWDQPTLATNDAAFHRPDAVTVGRLTELGVRWLFVDENDPALRSDLLGRVARLRYRAGAVAVYEL
jgi:hypothetical protein